MVNVFSDKRKPVLYLSKLLLLMLVVILTLGSSFALARQEIVSDRVTVIYKDPALADYALEVAEKAEASLDILVEILDFSPRHINIIIYENTDYFNGFASPAPHLISGIFTAFPHEPILPYRSEDPLYTLLLHELAHTLQLSYVETEPSDERVIGKERAIFTIGETANFAPYWFVEGFATWVESTYATGGRLHDAQTQGLIQSLVAEGNVPALSDIGKANFSEWPYGRARYLLGASFIDYLVQEYGFDALKKTLQANNSHFSILLFSFINFKSAWQQTNGTSLEQEWQNWQKSILEIVEEREFSNTIALTDFGVYQNNPIISPSGTTLAWLDITEKSRGLKVATLEETSEGIKLQNQRHVIDKTPTNFSWYSDHELLYSRIAPKGLTTFADIFLLDVITGIEKQLTYSSRLKEATYNPSSNCVLAYKDFRPEPAQLVEACFSDDTNLSVNRVWQLEDGVHILDIAISPKGDIALSIWKAGKADLALFDPDRSSINLLMNDVAQDLAPSWTNEGNLLFHSDRHFQDENSIGVFELYELTLDNSPLKLNRLTQSFGGAFQAVKHNDSILYSALDEGGFHLAQLPTTDVYATTSISNVNTNYAIQTLNFTALQNDGSFEVTTPFQTTSKLESSNFQATNYRPIDSMSPWSWTPIIDFSTSTDSDTEEEEFEYTLGLGIMGQDITNNHSYMAEAAYGTILDGHLDGSFANATYTYHTGLTSLGIKAGLWPYIGGTEGIEETALGTRVSVTNTILGDAFNINTNLSVGAIHLQSFGDKLLLEGNTALSIGNLQKDFWGYSRKGFDVELAAGLSPYSDGETQSTSLTYSFTTRYAQSLEDLTGIADLTGFAELYAQVGYNPLNIADSDTDTTGPDTTDTALVTRGHLGYHNSFDTKWGLGSSTAFVERISMEAKLESWYDSTLHFGGNVGVYADMVLSYLPIFSVGLETGYADEFYSEIKFKLPFEF